MKFRIETWTLKDLSDKYNQKKLDLNPSYQRRFIWSLSDQRTLIDSIYKGYAIPNIFLYEKSKGEFEMVDGQQRTRTILGFLTQQFDTFDGKLFSADKFPNFFTYQISVIIIESISKDENIEDFYALVNKAGVHLNRPELKKAEYFETNFLKLVTEISESEKIKKLELFTDAASKRMTDVDFVSELVTLLIDGNTDKKNAVDRKFEQDINKSEYQKLLKSADKILTILGHFNEKFPLKKTRYKQRNDLYTLVGFLKQIQTLPQNDLNYFYDLLVIFNDHITPSNKKCAPFQTYAFHCISQSNSKNARDERLKILNDIFLNKASLPSKNQKAILKYFSLNDSKENLLKINDFFVIDIQKLPNES